MNRVCPERPVVQDICGCYENPEPEEEPEPVAPPHKKMKVILNFQEYEDDDDDNDEDVKYKAGGRKDRGDRGQFKYLSDFARMFKDVEPRRSKTSMPVDSEKVAEAHKSSFCQLDAAAYLICLAYLLAVGITVLSFYYYVKDTFWNGIVKGWNSFPKVASDETFFYGKYLYLYNKEDKTLEKAHSFLLRGDRWMEEVHLAVMVSFLILTLFQCGSYVTRGKEDHTKILVGYFSIFAVLGAFAAVLPMISWSDQSGNYLESVSNLEAFADDILKNPRSGTSRITEATARDARRLAQIMKFCNSASDKGLASDETVYTVIFGRKYTLMELQTLGFCTHNKFKLASGVVTFVFAAVCFIIPCVHCFYGTGSDSKLQMNPELPPKANENQSEADITANSEELKAFKLFVEADDDL